MRTEADLQLAFGLLEQEVDDNFAAQTVPGEPVTVLLPVRRHQRPRPLLMAAAAAVALLLGLGSLIVYRVTRPVPTQAGGDQPAASHRLSFALKPGSGFTVIGARVDFAQHLVVAKGGRTYVVDVYPPGSRADITSTANARPVTVAGHRGWFGCVTSDPPGDWRRCTMGPLAWHYRPDSWVEIAGGTLGDLVRLGNQLDFDRHTATRSPLRLPAPADAKLIAWEVSYPGAARVRNWSGNWSAQVIYQWRRTGARVEIYAFGLAPTTREGAARQQLMVNGRVAWWYPQTHVLDVQLTPKSMFMVRGAGLAEPTAVAVARTIRVSTAPANMQTWWPVKEALP